MGEVYFCMASITVNEKALTISLHKKDQKNQKRDLLYSNNIVPKKLSFLKDLFFLIKDLFWTFKVQQQQKDFRHWEMLSGHHQR